MGPIVSSGEQSPVDLVNPTVPKPGSKESPQQAARMFEGMLMTQMFESMRKTIQPSGLFGENTQAKSTYSYLLDQAVVEHAMSSGKGWGLASRLEDAWKQAQGGK